MGRRLRGPGAGAAPRPARRAGGGRGWVPAGRPQGPGSSIFSLLKVLGWFGGFFLVGWFFFLEGLVVFNPLGCGQAPSTRLILAFLPRGTAGASLPCARINRPPSLPAAGRIPSLCPPRFPRPQHARPRVEGGTAKPCRGTPGTEPHGRARPAEAVPSPAARSRAPGAVPPRRGVPSPALV